MQRKQFLASTVPAILVMGSLPLSAYAQKELTGDTRLACEALLCLATGTRPTECNPSLARYFSIWSRTWFDTLQARVNFLNLCPAGNQTPQMSSLVNVIANGAGRCDVVSLNQDLQMWMSNGQGNAYVYISNQLPDYCSAYIGNAYTYWGDQTPKYVGEPLKGGYWVLASQYDGAYSTWLATQRQIQQSTLDAGSN